MYITVPHVEIETTWKLTTRFIQVFRTSEKSCTSQKLKRPSFVAGPPIFEKQGSIASLFSQVCWISSLSTVAFLLVSKEGLFPLVKSYLHTDQPVKIKKS